MIRAASDDKWTTGDEIRFLEEAAPKSVSKLIFLQNYKEALQARENWDDIDKKKLLKALDNQIKTAAQGG